MFNEINEKYELLSIKHNGNSFSLECLLYENTTSIKYNFIITLLNNSIECKNMYCEFEFWELCKFYKTLKQCYNTLNGKAIFKNLKEELLEKDIMSYYNYTNIEENKIEIEFLKYGQVKINGFIKDKYSTLGAGILFDFEVEQSYLGDCLKNIGHFINIINEKRKEKILL